MKAVRGEVKLRGKDNYIENLHPVLLTADHISSITCRYLLRSHIGTILYCLVTEAQGCE